MFCTSYINKSKKQTIIFLVTWKKMLYEKLVEHLLKITRVLMKRDKFEKKTREGDLNSQTSAITKLSSYPFGHCSTYECFNLSTYSTTCFTDGPRANKITILSIKFLV